VTFGRIALASLIVGAAVAGPGAIVRELRARVPALDRPRVRDVLVVAALVAITMSVYDRMVMGVPPTTADHNFHMLKAVQTENLLRRGHLTGWSDLELAGHPHNVLYPFGGTLLVAAIHALPGVSLDRAYAWAMLLVELATVLAVWAVARLHYGRAVALVAGVMALFDPGAWGVGGYVFTTDIGVWPSAVSIVLGIVALALVPRAVERGTLRAAIAPGVLLGVGVLFHPATVVVTSFASVFMAIALLVSIDPPPVRAIVLTAARVGLVALAICAFWFVPFVAQRNYVYHAPHITWDSASMWTAVIDGYGLHQAGMLEGATICGLLMLARRRDPFSRLVVVFLPCALAVLTIESLKLLHLLGSPPDFVSARFQPERILYLARVFGMIAAAFALVGLGARARVFTQLRGFRPYVLRFLLGGALALAVVLPGARVPGMVMTPQGLKKAERANVEKALDAATPLLAGGGRLVLFAEPGDHTLVGPAAARNVPIEKIGTSASTMFVTQFMTADNALWDLEMLRRTGARAVISKGPLPHWFKGPPLVERFGDIELHSLEPLPRAWIEGGPGDVKVVSWTDERIELDVSGAAPASVIRLMLGYHDAWRVEGGGSVRRWAWRDQGLAELPARDGRVVLAYRRPASEWLGLAISIALGALAVVLLRRERAAGRASVVEAGAAPVVDRDADVPSVDGDLAPAVLRHDHVEDKRGGGAAEHREVGAGREGERPSDRPGDDGSIVDPKLGPEA
jgi:hypothetical protein